MEAADLLPGMQLSLWVQGLAPWAGLALQPVIKGDQHQPWCDPCEEI